MSKYTRLDELEEIYFKAADATIMLHVAIAEPNYSHVRDCHIAYLMEKEAVLGVAAWPMIVLLYGLEYVPVAPFAGWYTEAPVSSPAPLPHETDAGRVVGTMTTWRDRRGSIEYAGGVVWCDASDVLGFTAFNLPHLKGYRVTFTLGAKRTARRVVVDEFQASLDAYARVGARRTVAIQRQRARPVNTKRRTPQTDSGSIMQHIKAMDEALGKEVK
jgi:hypothetical protein